MYSHRISKFLCINAFLVNFSVLARYFPPMHYPSNNFDRQSARNNKDGGNENGGISFISPKEFEEFTTNKPEILETSTSVAITQGVAISGLDLINMDTATVKYRVIYPGVTAAADIGDVRVDSDKSQKLIQDTYMKSNKNLDVESFISNTGKSLSNALEDAQDRKTKDIFSNYNSEIVGKWHGPVNNKMDWWNPNPPESEETTTIVPIKAENTVTDSISSDSVYTKMYYGEMYWWNKDQKSKNYGWNKIEKEELPLVETTQATTTRTRGTSGEDSGSIDTHYRYINGIRREIMSTKYGSFWYDPENFTWNQVTSTGNVSYELTTQKEIITEPESQNSDKIDRVTTTQQKQQETTTQIKLVLSMPWQPTKTKIENETMMWFNDKTLSANYGWNVVNKKDHYKLSYDDKIRFSLLTLRKSKRNKPTTTTKTTTTTRPPIPNNQDDVVDNLTSNETKMIKIDGKYRKTVRTKSGLFWFNDDISSKTYGWRLLKEDDLEKKSDDKTQAKNEKKTPIFDLKEYEKKSSVSNNDDENEKKWWVSETETHYFNGKIGSPNYGWNKKDNRKTQERKFRPKKQPEKENPIEIDPKLYEGKKKPLTVEELEEIEREHNKQEAPVIDREENEYLDKLGKNSGLHVQLVGCYELQEVIIIVYKLIL